MWLQRWGHVWNRSHKALDLCFMPSSYKGSYYNVKCVEFSVSSTMPAFFSLALFTLLYSDCFYVRTHTHIHTHQPFTKS